MYNSLAEALPYFSRQKIWKKLLCDSFHSPAGSKREVRASKNLAKLAEVGMDFETCTA